VELRRAAPILQLPETLHEIDRSTAETTPGFNE
jgi:hypothetical protein